MRTAPVYHRPDLTTHMSAFKARLRLEPFAGALLRFTLTSNLRFRTEATVNISSNLCTFYTWKPPIPNIETVGKALYLNEMLTDVTDMSASEFVAPCLLAGGWGKRYG